MVDSSEKAAVLGIMTSCLDVLCSWPRLQLMVTCVTPAAQAQPPDPAAALPRTLEIPSLTPLFRSNSRRSPHGEVSAGLGLKGGPVLWVSEETKESLGVCKLKSSDP